MCVWGGYFGYSSYLCQSSSRSHNAPLVCLCNPFHMSSVVKCVFFGGWVGVINKRQNRTINNSNANNITCVMEYKIRRESRLWALNVPCRPLFSITDLVQVLHTHTHVHTHTHTHTLTPLSRSIDRRKAV